jgi:hypothetical protein
MSSQIMRRDVEPLVSANFFDNYFNMIVLPNCHPQFYHGWIGEIKDLMTKHPSLYYSMLACSAAQVHSLSGTSQLHGLALEYYDRGIKYVSQLLDVDSVANHNGLLMSIILLYLHGCLGRATFSDVPRHVDAAINLLRLRLFTNRVSHSIRTTFDRIAIESALYQIFLTAAGPWVDPPASSVPIDFEFWHNAESLLSDPNSSLFPTHSASVNSPILGQPLALFRLVLTAKHLYQTRHLHHHHYQPHHSDSSPTLTTTLQDELADWEALVLRNADPDPAAAASNLSHYVLYKHATYLYILIASLLLDQAINIPPIPPAFSPTSEPTQHHPCASASTWQVIRIIQILRQHQGDMEWAKCFISNWPLYTCGFFMVRKEEQDVVRQELVLREKVTGFSQTRRFLEELEVVWAERGEGANGEEGEAVEMGWVGAGQSP